MPTSDLDRILQSTGLVNLQGALNKKTSEPTRKYNCIAHAFGDDQNWWWPNKLDRAGHDMNAIYWPLPSCNRTINDAFEEWLAHDGWHQTTGLIHEDDVIRVALYTDANGVVTHAARQLNDTKWTSKLGRALDLTHELWELDGPAYGQATMFYEKKR